MSIYFGLGAYSPVGFSRSLEEITAVPAEMLAKLAEAGEKGVYSISDYLSWQGVAMIQASAHAKCAADLLASRPDLGDYWQGSKFAKGEAPEEASAWLKRVARTAARSVRGFNVSSRSTSPASNHYEDAVLEFWAGVWDALPLRVRADALTEEADARDAQAAKEQAENVARQEAARLAAEEAEAKKAAEKKAKRAARRAERQLERDYPEILQSKAGA